MVVDYMHAVLLGAIKQHTELLLASVGESFYIGTPKMLKKIDDVLLKIRPPFCLTRTPRSLNDRKLWKASEWRNWLLFYAPLCLETILPKKYFKHIGLLSSSIYTLLKNKISKSDITMCKQNIDLYVIRFQKYFKKENMTYNIHLLQHIVTGVTDWGPIWNHNAFPFENCNRLILNMKQSPNQVLKQITNRYLVMHNIRQSNVSLYSLAKKSYIYTEKFFFLGKIFLLSLFIITENFR